MGYLIVRSMLVCRRVSFLVGQSIGFRRSLLPSHPSTVLRNYCAVKKLDGENELSNITDHIRSRMQRRLLHQPDHPLANIKQQIFEFFQHEYESTIAPVDGHPRAEFECFDDLDPVVTVKENFENLLTPENHPTRQRDESYYLNEDTLLRCHMTAHQVPLLRNNNRSAVLFAGDVYRRDTVDSTHSPVFHQLDGVRAFDNDHIASAKGGINTTEGRYKVVAEDMKNALEKMVLKLFGNDIQIRWVDAYFPFTEPSWEMEILFSEKSSQTSQQTEWLEVLGCGIMRSAIVEPVRPNSTSWAFGLGLERLAMILYKIPDIRLFWSKDPRFLDQFKLGQFTHFTPFSKYPPCYKDITFWITDEFTDNTFCELVRGEVGDVIESVDLLDHFIHPRTGRQSKCFRLNYRSMERSLTNEEVNEMQENIRRLVVDTLGVELR